MANAGQENADGDAAGDACDCSPSDEHLFAVPPEVSGVRWHSPTELRWGSALPQSGSDTLHQVYIGILGQFPVGSTASCIVETSAAPRLSALNVPPPGLGLWYLVQGVNACGAGTLGTWGSGTERPVPACTP